MVRTALLVLALAFGGGAPHLASFVDLVSAIWASDQADAGNILDPNGAVSHLDPDGAGTSDAGNRFDPNG